MSTGRLPSVDGGIQPTIVDAKGDLIVATTADTVSRLAVGSNDQVLTADSTTATGLKWAAPAAGANWSLLNAGGTALTGAQTITVSGISGANKIMVIVQTASSANTYSYIKCRLNTDTGSNYYQFGFNLFYPNAYAFSNLEANTGQDSGIDIGRMSGTASSVVFGYVLFDGCNSSGKKIFTSTGTGRAQGTEGQVAFATGGYYDSASTISSVSLFSSSGNFDQGTVFIYTSA